MPMTKLTKAQLEKKKHFIADYIKADSASNGSKLDANANVTKKNIATLSTELVKDVYIQVNREIVADKITELFGTELAENYHKDIESHNIYVHDESSIMPYCVSISMYPYLLDGLKNLGGESGVPLHLRSFCGGFINLVFAVSSQFAGAVATPEFLMYFDHFARRDFGDNYIKNHSKDMANYMQQIVYSLNQPAAARGYQCVTEDTEILTQDGWKNLSQLSIKDSCMSWNKKSNSYEMQTIDAVNVYDYDGKLNRMSGRGYQQIVTPTHRVVFKKTDGSGFDVKTSEELFGHKKLSLPITCNGIDRNDFEISDDMLKLCVAALTDGSIEDTGRLTFYFSPKRWLGKNLKNILDNCGIGYSKKESKCNVFSHVNIIRLSKIDAAVILRYIKHTKKEVPYFFNLLSKRQARLVIETWTQIDGSNRSGNKYIQCDSDEIADVMQAICIIAGYGSEKCLRTVNKFDNSGYVERWIIKISERDSRRISKFEKVHYVGKVWCPTVHNGFVVFREKNGVPYISGNSVFWNVGLFDQHYFDSMFGNFYFPNGDRPTWKSVDSLQRWFMSWLNAERTRSLLTFPVVTLALLSNGEKPMDIDWAENAAKEWSEGNQFFVYMSESVDSLSSCCRLRNGIETNEFSYTLGAGGVATGSINVITINMNRVYQSAPKDEFIGGRINAMKNVLSRVHKYQIAYRKLMEDYQTGGLLDVYTSGYIQLEKQFLTIGINGLVEAAEFCGIEASNNDAYKNFINSNLEMIYNANRAISKETGYKFNTEFIPGENLGVKNAKWDKADGLKVNRDCYNSYFFPVESEDINTLDKFILHGKDTTKWLDGGSALHLNLEEYPTKDGYIKLLTVMAKTGCPYMTTNIKVTICRKCGHIDKRTLTTCARCGSDEVDWATRIIGYLKKIKSFSSDRQIEAAKRYYHSGEKNEG